MIRDPLPEKRFPGTGSDPWTKARLCFSWRGRTLSLLAPYSVFSNTRIDRGTLLLLDHLPAGEPEAFLDLGCGYGALGLAVASQSPKARGLLLDRDLLAVEFCRRNAAALGIPSVKIIGSLGFRDIPPAWGRFDWILANVPARAGERVFKAFIAEGRGRLSPGGEMRLVAILPLSPAIERAAREGGFEFRKVAASRQHVVFAFPPGEVGRPGDEEIYQRDTIELSLPERLELARPTDLADEPHRLPVAIPLLAEALPAVAPARALSFRCGYGLLPALLLERYPEARVMAADRDLLATSYTRRNCRAHGERLQVVECLGLKPIEPLGPFDLIVGELSPPAGQAAILQELGEVRGLLAPGGRALILGFVKQWREFLREEAERPGLQVLKTKGQVALFEMKKHQLASSGAVSP
ncbi:MAG: methyltransferase [Planctomycetes bacterium]|nr:methyltransferase [Planctomycetota bacterium]